ARRVPHRIAATAAVCAITVGGIAFLEARSTSTSEAAESHPGDARPGTPTAAPASPPQPTPPPEPPPFNVPMTRLAPGETPPQFVLFSFDGVGVTPNWDMFL